MLKRCARARCALACFIFLALSQQGKQLIKPRWATEVNQSVFVSLGVEFHCFFTGIA